MLPENLQQRLQALGLFDAEWYRAHYPDVAASGLAPWEHFVRYGALLGRRPGPGFDPVRYLEANPDVGGAATPPLVHYLRDGEREGRRLTPAEASTDEAQARGLLAASELFDAEWYLAEYPDIARAGLEPLRHYLTHGAAEGRDPGPWFDTRFYLSQLPLDEGPLPGGQAPLLHYLTAGQAQGLAPWPQPTRVPAWYERGAPEEDGALRVLYVLSVRTGGTPQTNEDLMRAQTVVAAGSPYLTAEIDRQRQVLVRTGYFEQVVVQQQRNAESGTVDRIEREMRFEGDLSDEQRARLLDIADKCPVHRTLTSENNIRTVVAPDP